MIYKYRFNIILIVLIGLWALCLEQRLRFFDSFTDGVKVKVRGSVTSQPYHKLSKHFMKIGWVNVQIESFPRYRYGDYLEVSGILQKRMTNSFAPEIWLMYPEIEISQKPGNLRLLDFSSLLVKLHGFKRKVVSNFASLLPEPQASLLSGILLGVRSRMPEDFV